MVFLLNLECKLSPVFLWHVSRVQCFTWHWVPRKRRASPSDFRFFFLTITKSLRYLKWDAEPYLIFNNFRLFWGWVFSLTISCIYTAYYMIQPMPPPPQQSWWGSFQRSFQKQRSQKKPWNSPQKAWLDGIIIILKVVQDFGTHQQYFKLWGWLPLSSSWWNFKYFLFSSRNLGKMNPFWRAYFSKGLVQPPTSWDISGFT